MKFGRANRIQVVQHLSGNAPKIMLTKPRWGVPDLIRCPHKKRKSTCGVCRANP